MALSLDDRILGEKVDNYCSSSEDEAEDEDEGEVDEGRNTKPTATFIPEDQLSQGPAINTGPKGVLNDWRRYKQLETELREEQEIERLQLAKKLSMTCRSHLNDEEEKRKDEELLQQLEEFEDEFMKEYRQKRLEEMRAAFSNVPKFGSVVSLNKQDFVEAVDQENPAVLIIVHLYEDGVAACDAMNGCLQCLAKEYPTVKFCKIKASDAKLSMNFSSTGVPALLIYKSKELVGNFVRISDELGDDFFATDVEAFLQENGFFTDENQKNKIIRSATDDDDGSDFDID